jgi:hypothetical protein
MNSTDRMTGAYGTGNREAARHAQTDRNVATGFQEDAGMERLASLSQQGHELTPALRMSLGFYETAKAAAQRVAEAGGH